MSERWVDAQVSDECQCCDGSGCGCCENGGCEYQPLPVPFKREPLPPRLAAFEYERKFAAYTESITDAVRLGVGHAIQVIEDYAKDVPVSKPFCDDLTAILRRHTASVGKVQ